MHAVRSLFVVGVALLAACSQSAGASGGGLPSLSSHGSGAGSTGAQSSSDHSGSSSHSSGGHESSGGATSASDGSGGSSSTGAVADAGPPIAVSGTIGGKSVDVANVLSFLSNGSLLLLEGTDDAAFTCDLAALTAGGVNFASVASLSITLIGQSGLTPGVYSAGAADASDGTELAASYTRNDSTCTASVVAAVTGSVTIAAISATSVTGSFQLGFGTAGSVTGTFNTPFCVLSTDAGLAADAGSCRPRP